MAPSKNGDSPLRRRRLVLLPCPLQGHVNPMLQLAALLHSHGFSITIVHTTFNAPDPSSHPDFTFAFISAAAETEISMTTSDVASFLIAINANVQEPFRDQLEKMMAAAEDGDVPACLIADAMMYAAGSAAEIVGLPRIAFRTGGAACFNVFFAVPMLCEKGYYPIEDCKRDDPVVGLPPFKVGDLPNFDKENWHKLRNIIVQMIEGVRSSRAVVMNTFEALDAPDLVRLRRQLRLPIFPIGPLHRLSSDVNGSLQTDDRSCIKWLNQQERRPNSVLYVSFGSLASLSRKELFEMAVGLAASGQPFLWVLRNGSVVDGTTDLPPDFEEATTGGWGKVVRWAPQREVLRHPAVGGFWTHCGWNSILESISEAVPMLCWPRFGDQMANSRMVTDVWKVGVALTKELERGEVERAVRRFMAGEEEGMKRRERIAEMKAKADLCTEEHGTSRAYLQKLLHFCLPAV